MVLKHLCVLMPWAKVATALGGLVMNNSNSTHPQRSCSSVPLLIVLWIYNTFDNYLGTGNDFTKYFKDGYKLCFLVNISPSNRFLNIVYPVRFYQNCPNAFGRWPSINGLILLWAGALTNCSCGSSIEWIPHLVGTLHVQNVCITPPQP